MSRTPITDEGFHAHRADTIACLAAGELTLSALADRPTPPRAYAGATVRDVEGEMADVFRENPGLTLDELAMTGRFDLAQIERHGKSAVARAGRESVRRVA